MTTAVLRHPGAEPRGDSSDAHQTSPRFMVSQQPVLCFGKVWPGDVPLMGNGVVRRAIHCAAQGSGSAAARAAWTCPFHWLAGAHRATLRLGRAGVICIAILCISSDFGKGLILAAKNIQFLFLKFF